MSFENIIGNENVKKILDNTIRSNNILHSYLFAGTDGIGKKLFAIEFAKMILCSGEHKPCNNCKSCIEFDNNNNPDFKTIEKDYDSEKNKEKNSISINQIRYLNSKISEKPITSNRKVYIINNADAMTIEAQNSLLKTLEEPPEYATIILVAANVDKLLNTIKSRSIKIGFNKISDEEIEKYIKKFFPEEINIDISAFGGSIGNVYKINENKEAYTNVENILSNIDKNDLIYTFNNSEVLYKSKDIILDLLEYINILLLKSKKINKVNCVKYVEEAKKRIISNSNYDMTIDNLLMKMWEEINEKYSRS